MAAAAAAARQLAASSSVGGAASARPPAVARVGGPHGGIPSGRPQQPPPLAKDKVERGEMVDSFFSGERPWVTARCPSLKALTYASHNASYKSSGFQHYPR